MNIEATNYFQWMVHGFLYVGTRFNHFMFIEEPADTLIHGEREYLLSTNEIDIYTHLMMAMEREYYFIHN